GGSAADAQHLAAEYVVRYQRARRACAAVALTTDTSILTAAGNDMGFEHVFARQVQALARRGDLLVIHSTSGRSPNVLEAARAARDKGVAVLAFTAGDGGPLRGLSDHAVVVPVSRTDRAQELHLCIEHAICDLAARAARTGDGRVARHRCGYGAAARAVRRGRGHRVPEPRGRCGRGRSA